jgi:hypothetical protein
MKHFFIALCFYEYCSLNSSINFFKSTDSSTNSFVTILHFCKSKTKEIKLNKISTLLHIYSDMPGKTYHSEYPGLKSIMKDINNFTSLHNKKHTYFFAGAGKGGVLENHFVNHAKKIIYNDISNQSRIYYNQFIQRHLPIIQTNNISTEFCNKEVSISLNHNSYSLDCIVASQLLHYFNEEEMTIFFNAASNSLINHGLLLMTYVLHNKHNHFYMKNHIKNIGGIYSIKNRIPDLMNYNNMQIISTDSYDYDDITYEHLLVIKKPSHSFLFVC